MTHKKGRGFPAQCIHLTHFCQDEPPMQYLWAESMRFVPKKFPKHKDENRRVWQTLNEIPNKIPKYKLPKILAHSSL